MMMLQGLTELPVEYNITYVKGKQIDKYRSSHFCGIHSYQEEDNVIGVIDLAFEAERMAMDGHIIPKGSPRAPVGRMNVPITFDDEEDMIIDFDA